MIRRIPLKYLFIFLCFGFLYSCGSEITVTSLSNKNLAIDGAGGGAGAGNGPGGDAPIAPLVENTVITSSYISDISETGFSITVNYTGDDNSNASGVLYYCNETDNPGCDPISSGINISLNKNGSDEFNVVVSGLSAPYDIGDQINYIVVISDSDGVSNLPNLSQTRLLTFYKIFRSVGANNTASLANGSANNLLISNSIANFAVALPDNIGVGDALQFDNNNDGTVDKIVFFQERVDANNFKVSNANGSAVSDLVIADQDWDIFRSYTSLVNAEAGTENSGINASVRNFDTWIGGKNLVDANQQWNIALYADGFEVINSSINFLGWTTNVSNFVNIFTPYKLDQVGVSQRHSGAFDLTKYYLHVNATANYARGIQASIQNMVIDGLQILVENNSFSAASGIFVYDVDVNDNFRHEYKNNIIRGKLSGVNAYGISITSFSYPSAEYRLSNNIIADFPKLSSGNSYCFYLTSAKVYAYNNTAHNCETSFRGNTTTVLKNNLSSDSNYYGPFSPDSSHNAISTAVGTGGANDITNAKIAFKNPAFFDFNIAGHSYSVIGNGLDLSADHHYPIDTDILGNTRTRWDRGASTAHTAIFRSMGFGSTASLANGSSNDLSITVNSDGHTVASFAADVPANIGVGDVIQYDADNSAGVDHLAFISQRIDAKNFIVKNTAGANASITTASSQSWDIFRAYTSTANAESGIENTAFNDALENFDTWSGGRDLVSNKEEWHIALYADAVETINASVTVSGWQANEDFGLKFFTPHESTQVGFSQRHKGIVDKKFYLLESSEVNGIYITDKYVTIEGLQVKTTVTTAVQYIGCIYVSQTLGTTDSTKNIVSNNLLEMNTNQVNYNYYGFRYVNDQLNENAQNYIVNNIVYFSGSANGQGIRFLNGKGYLYNNTATSVAYGIRIDAGSYVAVNNLISQTAGIFDAKSDFNISENLNNTGGTNDLVSQTILYNNRSHFDFRITSKDLIPFDYAKDLSSDPYYAFSTDINNKTRSRWDVGATEAAIQIFRSVGANNTNSLANGTSNNLTIANGVASFATALPMNIGVGDALQYDADNNGSIDTVIFIHKRNSATSYDVRLATGLVPSDMAVADNDWSIYRAYTGIEDVVSGDENSGLDVTIRNFDTWTNGKDLVASNEELNIALYADGSDVINTANFANFTTDYNNELNIFTPVDITQVGYRQRHEGIWDDKYYHLNITSSWGRVLISGNTNLIGLQVGTPGGLAGVRPISVTNANDVVVDSNLVRGSTDLGNDNAYFVNAVQNEYARIYFVNNYAFDISDDGGNACFGAYSYALKTVHVYFYNNTAVNCQNGFSIGGSGGNTKIHMSNNLSVNSLDNDYIGTSLLVENQNNLSSDATSPFASLRNKTVSFLNASAKDFRLSPLDTEAKNQGVDLSLDFFENRLFAIDHLGHARGSEGAWDIGAHEAASMIFRSVGPVNIAALQTGGGNNLTINGSVATFSSALSNTIGVGDAIQYDSDNNGSIDALMFINERLDAFNVKVVDAQGHAVADMVTSDQDWSLFRAYTSLRNAESGAENTGIDASLRDFDPWLSTTLESSHDLIADNKKWNIALYADGTDTQLANFDYWVVGATNELKIFTPNLVSEVGVSQRHTGRWDTTKYHMICANIDACLKVGFTGAHIEGLQVENTTSLSTGNPSGIIAGGASGNSHAPTIVKNNIVRNSGGGVGTSLDVGVMVSTRQGLGPAFAINNLVTNFGAGIVSPGASGDFYFYNNTVINNTTGIVLFLGSTSVNLKNNLAQGATTNYTIFPAVTAENNISSDATAVGVGSQINRVVKFIDATNGDYRLAVNETYAKNTGTNLANDSGHAFTDDLKGETRTLWDIGAFSYVDYATAYTDFRAEGSGSLVDPYRLYSKAQLQMIGSDPVNGCNANTTAACASHFKLNADINLNNESYTPIGTLANLYSGTFDGNNKIIDNLNINAPGSNYQGLIAATCAATITNLNLTDVTIVGQDYTGAFVGNLRCNGNVFTNNTLERGTVTGNDQVGGAIGQGLNTATITDSYTNVTVNGVNYVGGFLGDYQNFSTVDRIYALGDVIATGNIVGGLMGRGGNQGGSWSDLYAMGKVMGVNLVGGLFGISSADNFTLNTSYASGSVVSTQVGGNSDAGGLIGSVENATGDILINNSYSLADVYAFGDRVGGLVGNIDNAGTRTINTSWAAGDIKSSAGYIGGLIGSNEALINDSYAMGRVEGGSTRIGGLVGYSNANIDRSFSLGEVYGGSATQYVGGLVGFANSNITKSHASGNVYTGAASVGGLVGEKNAGQILQSFAWGDISSSSFSVGGLVGTNQNALIQESYAKGKVSGIYNIGSFIGHMPSGTVENSYATGDAVGSTDIGGFIGALDSGSVVNNYTVANTTGGANTNAFIGTYTGGTLTDNFYNSDKTVATDPNVGVSALTEAEFRDDLNFDLGQSGTWDYTTVWTQLDMRSYPIHKNSYEGYCVDNPVATTYDATGAGTLSDPYIICNTFQYHDIGANGCNNSDTAACDKVFVLGADLDFRGMSTAQIGGDSLNSFSGVFNGNFHSISNFYLNNPTSYYQGLFKYLSGSVYNFKIINSLIFAGNHSGLLVGEISGANIHNLDISGSLNGGSWIGGMVGGRGGVDGRSNITNSTYTGKISATGGTVGGVLGLGRLADHISKTVVSANITLGSSNTRGGGIVGDEITLIKKSKTSGSLSGGGLLAGILGNNNSLDTYMDQVYSSMDITALSGNYAAGLWASGSNVGHFSILNDSYSTHSIIDGGGIGQLVGGISGYRVQTHRTYASNDPINSSNNIGGVHGGGSSGNYNYWNTDINALLDGSGLGSGSLATRYEGKTSADLLLQATYATWDFTNIWAIGESVRSPILRWMLHPLCQANMSAMTYSAIGAGTAQNPYKICFKEQLMDLSENAVTGCNASSGMACDKHFVLMNDIDLKDEAFIPIGLGTTFDGFIDGAGHTIFNLTINLPSIDRIGFLSNVSHDTYLVAKDLNFVFANIIGQDEVGILAGNFYRGNAINISTHGVLNGNNEVGGLVGLNGGNITSSRSRVDISANSSIGGIAGINWEGLFNCHAYGTISGVSQIGGLVGSSNYTSFIEDSTARVDISATGSQVGGVIGVANGGGHIKNSFALGDVTSTVISGFGYIAGFAGAIDDVIIENNYSLGSVNAPNAGRVGGFAGDISASAIINNNYSAATSVVGAGAEVHAFLGSDDAAATLANNYWDATLIPDTDSSPVGRFTGLATVNMDDASSFTGWDFTNTWRVFSGRSPELIKK